MSALPSTAPNHESAALLERKLLGSIARASADFRLIEPGDRVMVAVSGGKDSMSLLYLLRELSRRTPFPFSIIAVNLDQKQPGFPEEVLPEYFRREGFEFRIIEEDTYSIVKEKVPEGRTTCSLCSRLRRGILYNVAVELGATKIALGHHRDDAIETLLLNQFYSGQLKAMPARLHSDDGRNVVIRPLIYCAESDLEQYAQLRAFPIIPCNLCGSQENLKRQAIKQLLIELERDNPKLRGNLLASLKNVRPTHLLAPELTYQSATPTESAEPREHLVPAIELVRNAGA
jgi:tRNA 2-thiocytidine biosynthesis protein TtcA